MSVYCQWLVAQETYNYVYNYYMEIVVSKYEGVIHDNDMRLIEQH